MLSMVGLGAHKLSKFNFNFTPPSNAPKMPPVEAATPTKILPITGKDLTVTITDAPREGKAVTSAKKGKKRRSREKEKIQKEEQPQEQSSEKEDATMAEDTTNAAEAEDSKDSKSKTPKQETQKNDSAPKDVKDNQPKRKKQKQDTSKDNKDQSSKPQRQKEKQKLPRLPDNAKISKRPIHHPAIPSPFSSSSSQKVVYIKTHSKLIPTTKLIRKLLSQVENREKKSLSSKKIRLNPQKVEQAIVDAGKEKGGVRNSEPVFVKATGKAIETALEIGLFFQQQADCRVRIETASAEAIDDILLERVNETEKDCDEIVEEHEAPVVDEADIEVMDVEEVAVDEVSQKGKETKENKKAKGEGKKRKFEEVPETRIRTVSTITVAISLK